MVTFDLAGQGLSLPFHLKVSQCQFLKSYMWHIDRVDIVYPGLTQLEFSLPFHLEESH